ncbi:MAG: ABC transporter substrate-binding protein [Thermomicrobiales bacterium]|nr:ABC transporter substrate-binding protein [Thermomicrobiales bacterium]
MSRTRLFALLAAVALMLAPAAAIGHVTAQDDDPIILGAPVNLTGWMAAYDQPPLDGAKLAVEKINEAGGVLGRPLQIIEVDGKTDPATVGNAALEVIDDGAEVILAPCDFDYGAPASQAAQEAGMVGVSFCASSPLFGSATLGDKQFTVSMWNQTMAAAAAEFGYNVKEWRTAATIIDQGTEYTKSLGDFFVETWGHLGGEVVSEDTYQLNDMQASAQAQRIMDLETPPDVIFISANMPDYSAIIRDIRSAGVTAPIMGGDSMDTADFYTALGSELGNDIYISTHAFIGAEAGPAMEQFIADYTAKYGNPPEVSFNAMGWDTVQILANAIERAGTTDGEALAQAMADYEYNLLSGKLTWSDAESGHIPQKEAFIIEVVDGQPTFVQSLAPSWTPGL